VVAVSRVDERSEEFRSLSPWRETKENFIVQLPVEMSKQAYVIREATGQRSRRQISAVKY
jgi:hypothetical protein